MTSAVDGEELGGGACWRKTSTDTARVVDLQ